MDFLSSVLSAVGAVTVIGFAYRLFNFVQLNYLAQPDLKKKYAKAGNWAVVTGATEGIGYAVSMDLARRGFNVCIIARTQSKLDAAAENIKKRGVDVKTISFDFAVAGDAEYKALFAQLESIEIALLVNNVGVNYLYANYFDQAAIDDDIRIIKVNCEATVRMTKYVVPRMKEKRAGGILTLGSFSAVTPTPMLATYAGSKAFNISFGQSMAYELRQFGIDVLAVTPNLVVSKMTQGGSSRQPKESFLMVGAAPMAQQTLNKLGAATRTAGHGNHAIIELIVNMLPEAVTANKILDMHKAIKSRAERKK